MKGTIKWLIIVAVTAAGPMVAGCQRGVVTVRPDTVVVLATPPAVATGADLRARITEDSAVDTGGGAIERIDK